MITPFGEDKRNNQKEETITPPTENLTTLEEYSPKLTLILDTYEEEVSIGNITLIEEIRSNTENNILPFKGRQFRVEQDLEKQELKLKLIGT